MSRLFIMFCMNHFRPNNRRHSCIRCRGASCYLLSRIWFTIQAAKEENWSQTRGKKKWRQRNMNDDNEQSNVFVSIFYQNLKNWLICDFLWGNTAFKFDFSLLFFICLCFCQRWNVIHTTKSVPIIVHAFRYHLYLVETRKFENPLQSAYEKQKDIH